MTPELFSCYFGDGTTYWPRLARVLSYTAERHCPEWERAIVRISPGIIERSQVYRTASPAHVQNTQKLDVWADLVRIAPDGQAVVLLDADMAILRPLDDIWEQSFDLAYTARQGFKYPLNCGAVFLRVSDRTRRFMSEWADENRRQLADEARHRQWLRLYGGINQASFGALLASDRAASVQLLQLPCLEWNCEDSSWGRFDPAKTRIAHIKSSLRRAALGKAVVMPQHLALVKVWRQLDAEASRAETR